MSWGLRRLVGSQGRGLRLGTAEVPSRVSRGEVVVPSWVLRWAYCDGDTVAQSFGRAWKRRFGRDRGDPLIFKEVPPCFKESLKQNHFRTVSKSNIDVLLPGKTEKLSPGPLILVSLHTRQEQAKSSYAALLARRSVEKCRPPRSESSYEQLLPGRSLPRLAIQTRRTHTVEVRGVTTSAETSLGDVPW